MKVQGRRHGGGPFGITPSLPLFVSALPPSTLSPPDSKAGFQKVKMPKKKNKITRTFHSSHGVPPIARAVAATSI